MTRKIKAQDVKPGMKILWEERGYGYHGKVEDVRPNNVGLPGESVEVLTTDDDWHSFAPTFEVKLIAEPQPDEPTAFGACVEVAGVKYVRCDDDELEWKSSDGSGWWGWLDLCDDGHVTVVNADPFATPAHDVTEPRTWDRWEDVPDMTAVRGCEIPMPYRKGPEGRAECRYSDGNWYLSFADGACSMNRSAPFTEVI